MLIIRKPIELIFPQQKNNSFMMGSIPDGKRNTVGLLNRCYGTNMQLHLENFYIIFPLCSKLFDYKH